MSSDQYPKEIIALIKSVSKDLLSTSQETASQTEQLKQTEKNYNTTTSEFTSFSSNSSSKIKEINNLQQEAKALLSEVDSLPKSERRTPHSLEQAINKAPEAKSQINNDSNKTSLTK